MFNNGVPSREESEIRAFEGKHVVLRHEKEVDEFTQNWAKKVRASAIHAVDGEVLWKNPEFEQAA